MLYVLVPAALITAVISGIIGGGGGMLLLATLYCFLSHGEAVPTHATVQLAANGTRILAFLKHVDWRTLRRFLLGLVPGGVLGTLLLIQLGQPEQSEPYLKMLVGVYILAATFVPKSPRAEQRAASGRSFTIIGFVCGTAALTVGAIGPLMAPIFAREGFVKERLVATKSTCQMVAHVAKIPVFLCVRDLDLSRLGLVIALMCAVAIPGTLLGKYVLRFVSERHFKLIYRVALVVAGVKVLAVDGLWALLQPA